VCTCTHVCVCVCVNALGGAGLKSSDGPQSMGGGGIIAPLLVFNSIIIAISLLETKAQNTLCVSYFSLHCECCGRKRLLPISLFELRNNSDSRTVGLKIVHSCPCLRRLNWFSNHESTETE
jgi:hypothetical protein